MTKAKATEIIELLKQMKKSKATDEVEWLAEKLGVSIPKAVNLYDTAMTMAEAGDLD
jgi:hypothetical protein